MKCCKVSGDMAHTVVARSYKLSNIGLGLYLDGWPLVLADGLNLEGQ